MLVKRVSTDSVTIAQYWVAVLLAVYGAASTVASPLWGWYTDRLQSRRLPFLFGLVIITGATILIWLGHSIILQIVGRLLQGFAGAIVWVTGLHMVADTVDQSEVGQYIGYLSIALMVSTFIAPLLGGIVLAKAGYNAVFQMTLAIIGLDVILRLMVTDTKDALEWQLTTKTTTIQEQHRPHQTEAKSTVEIHPPPSPHDTNSTSLSTDSSQRKHLPPILTLLSSRRLIVALWSTLIVGGTLAGLQTVLPLQTQALFGWDSIGGGLIFLTLTVPAFFGPAIGWICDRYGSRWPVVTGLLGLCPFLTLLRLVNRDTLGQKVLLSALLTLVGCCFTLTMDPLMAEVSYIVEEQAATRGDGEGRSMVKAYAQAFGLWNMAFSLGDTLGPLVAGFVRDKAGWPTMSWVLGLLGGLTAMPAVLWCGGWISSANVVSIGGTRPRIEKELPASPASTV
ncbi:MAG: hypothetical protein Q9218_003115 [Villophora microphyllina]